MNHLQKFFRRSTGPFCAFRTYAKPLFPSFAIDEKTQPHDRQEDRQKTHENRREDKKKRLPSGGRVGLVVGHLLADPSRRDKKEGREHDHQNRHVVTPR